LILSSLENQNFLSLNLDQFFHAGHIRRGAFDLGVPQKVSSVPDIVRVMDLQQEQLARGLGEGHRVIHGVAGSKRSRAHCSERSCSAA
jgi:hypothetical protein